MFSINSSSVNNLNYPSTSSLVRYLDSQEQLNIINEINSISNWYWDWQHDPASVGTEHFIKHIDNDLRITRDNLNNFPNTKAIIESITSTATLGRIGFTRVIDRVGPFTWENIPLVRNNIIDKRYILFINMQSKYGGVVLDSNPVMDPSILNFAIYEFALTKTLFFANTTGITSYYLMFDTIKNGIMLTP